MEKEQTQDKKYPYKAFKEVRCSFGSALTDIDWITIREIEEKGNFYHCFAPPENAGWTGRYDISKILDKYILPDDFTGKSVLDVGPADGFFSFLAESRNADRVLAIQPAPAYPGLSFAHRYRQSVIGFCQKSVYELNQIKSDTDRFDYVFCFSVLLHLPDLYSAISGLFNATVQGGSTFIATTVDDTVNDRPYAYFHGEKKDDGLKSSVYYIFWYPNSLALEKMALLAGFREVIVHRYFYLSEAMNPPRSTSKHIFIQCIK